MRCSRCSSEVLPVVALDIDGTMGDYHGQFTTFAQRYLDAKVPTRFQMYDGTEPHREWFCRNFQVDAVTFREIKNRYRRGGLMRSMLAYPGAELLSSACFEAGAEVWVTTTRPDIRLDGIDPDTRFWLERNNIHYDGLLYHGDKYQWMAENFDPARVIAVLDDLPEQLEVVQEHFGAQVPILRRTEYNRNVRNPWFEATELSQAQTIIIDRIEQWKERYAN